MKRTLGWTAILLPFAIILVLLATYVWVGRTNQSALPNGEAQNAEPQTP